jgi:hypothetical protein
MPKKFEYGTPIEVPKSTADPAVFSLAFGVFAVLLLVVHFDKNKIKLKTIE